MKMPRIFTAVLLAFICLIAPTYASPKTGSPLPAKFFEGIRESVPGFITVHYSDDKVFFEIPDSILGRDVLIAVRASELSNNRQHIAAGQMRHNPMLVQFSADHLNVYLHQVVSVESAGADDPVRLSLERNSLVPIIEAFKMVHRTATTSVFDFTSYLREPIEPISPFADRAKPGAQNHNLTRFLSVKTFENNIELKTRFGFKGREPFLAIMQRSFVLLPRETMRPRLNDRRVGYFNESKRMYSSDQISVQRYAYISRFDLQPREEDLIKYQNGELVEPAKPIVFYIDDAFPHKWKPYIKAGIEDWQLAFEAIGFKNAIIAKDFPKDDPSFDPDDIQFSTFRYVTTPDANAQGQRWIDPRSGEILQADVIWYSNVTEKLYQWLFVQTAAVNPAVRGQHVADAVIGETIRYAAAHEIGHSLGLSHNFRAHYAFPVDSLRSGTFTQAYGTCSSLMDYARNNYIAQPGDENIKFTPPIMGAYDYFAIKYGYKPIFEAADEFLEVPVLNQWILDKSDDPAFWYGRQLSKSDPSSQSEALGNDVVKAGRYGADNIRVILKNIVEWMAVENEDYSNLTSMHQALMRQYGHYFKHAYAQIGGIREYLGIHGQERDLFSSVSRLEQRDALQFILDELFMQFEWMNPPHISGKIGSYQMEIYEFQKVAMETLCSRDQFLQLVKSASMSDDPYSLHNYLNDMSREIFTSQGSNISRSVKNIQVEYARQLSVILKNPDDYKVIGNELMPSLHHQQKTIVEDVRRKGKRAKGEMAVHYQYIQTILAL